MKPLYTIVLLLLSAFITTAQEKGDMVIEDRLLTWDDFQGKHKSDAFDAMTYYIIIMEPNRYMPGDPVPDYKVVAYFKQRESSVDRKFMKERTDEVKAHVLKHEQGHYDIARIAARQINDIYKNFSWHPRRSLYQADSIYRSINNKMRALQLKYDKETNHSKIKEEQLRWNKLIADALDNRRLPE
ncbi:MAG: DUF922 domain-containing protein [Flavipsychrobacter sp.]